MATRTPGIGRVAVLTSDFSGFTGAEIVALEAANDFAARGAEVVLRAERYSDAMRPFLAPGVRIAERRIDITEFDTVWSQHGQFCLNIDKPAKLASWKGNFLSVHLSSSTGAEAFHHPFAVRFAGARVINCSRAIDQLEEGREVVGQTFNLRNAAPARFHRAPRPPVGTLRRLLLVSNHVPEEVAAAMTLLAERGVEVHHLGAAGTFKLIEPSDILDCDAVLTIGKTVQYALVAARPVYCYDHFAGPGWVSRENFDLAEHRNFSGRCHPQPKTAAQIAAELQSGFAEAEAYVNSQWQQLSQRYDYERIIDEVIAAEPGNFFDQPDCVEMVELMRGTSTHFERIWRDVYAAPVHPGELTDDRHLQHLSDKRQAEVLAARVAFLEEELSRHRRAPWLSLGALSAHGLLSLASRMAEPLSRRHASKLRRSAAKRGPDAYRRRGQNLSNL